MRRSAATTRCYCFAGSAGVLDAAGSIGPWRSRTFAHTVRFDGKWQTTVSCEPSRGALGFSYQFISEVKDGKFHGLRGKEGEPSSLLIEGTHP